MKRLILIGSSGAGKTTLCQRLKGEKMLYKKTQALEFHDSIIDTPGEYIENRNYYKAIIISTVEADIIALVQDALREGCIFPPAFGGSFAKPIIGIITKIDLANEKQLMEAEECLRSAGSERVFKISNTLGLGIKELMDYLQ